MKGNTTYEIFISFVVAQPNGQYDATGVVSKACYSRWLNTRRVVPQNPPHAFRKALTGHCRGDKGLQPYPVHIEEAILKVLRTSKVWSCFEGTDISIGKRGFQTYGFWEKKRRTHSNKRVYYSECIEESNKKIKVETPAKLMNLPAFQAPPPPLTNFPASNNLLGTTYNPRFTLYNPYLGKTPAINMNLPLALNFGYNQSSISSGNNNYAHTQIEQLTKAIYGALLSNTLNSNINFDN